MSDEVTTNPAAWCSLKDWSKVDITKSEDETFSISRCIEGISVDSITNLPLDNFRLIKESEGEVVYRASALLGLSSANIDNPDDKQYINRTRYIRITKSLK